MEDRPSFSNPTSGSLDDPKNLPRERSGLYVLDPRVGLSTLNPEDTPVLVPGRPSFYRPPGGRGTSGNSGGRLPRWVVPGPSTIVIPFPRQWRRVSGLSFKHLGPRRRLSPGWCTTDPHTRGNVPVVYRHTWGRRGVFGTGLRSQEGPRWPNHSRCRPGDYDVVGGDPNGAGAKGSTLRPSTRGRVVGGAVS